MRRLGVGWLCICAICGCSEAHAPASAAGADAGAIAGAIAGEGAHAGSGSDVLQDSLAFAIGGRRLRARYFAADGAEQFRTMYDGELGFACEFVPDVAGEGMHCVPRSVFDAIFLDSNCTDPIVAVQGGDAPQQLDWLSVRSSEPVPSCTGASVAPRQTYRLGDSVFSGGIDAIGMTPPTAYAKHGGSCEPTAVQMGLLLPSLYRLRPQAASQLVAGTVSKLEVGGGLSIRRVIAEDGAEITIDVLGAAVEPCVVQRDGVCTPSSFALEQGGFYLDGACETDAFFAPPNPDCETTSIGVRDIGDVVRVFELVPAHDVFVRNTIIDPSAAPGSDPAFSCDAYRDTASVFAAGNEITSTFPRANALLTGAGALHMVRFVAKNPAGVRDDRVVFLDGGGEFINDEGRRCLVDPEPQADGTYLCSTEYLVVEEPRVALGSVELVER